MDKFSSSVAKSIVWLIYFWYAALAMFISSATLVPTIWTTQQRRKYTSDGKEHSFVYLFLVSCFDHVHQFRHFGSHHMDTHNKGEHTLVMAKNIVWFVYFWYAALAMFTSSATWVPTTWATQQRRTYTSGGKEHSLVGLFLVCCFSHRHANAFHVRGLIESSDGAVINYCKLAT